MSDDLIQFIIKSRERGRSDEQISRALLSVGWSKEKVQEALAKASVMQKEEKWAAPKPEAPAAQQPAPAKVAAPIQPPSTQPQQPGAQQQIKPQVAQTSPAPPLQTPITQASQPTSLQPPIDLPGSKPAIPIISDVVKSIRAMNFNTTMILLALIVLAIIIIGGAYFILFKFSLTEEGRIIKPYQPPKLSEPIPPPPPLNTSGSGWEENESQ
ncbi:MAG: hypothetical protein N3G22_00515 [Candidatus Micrarchaeota archaeon]|nr:hypothetical protein [Candidatus Micrarchaeota archaeon]